MIEVNGKKIAVVVYSAGRAEALQTTRWLTDKRCYLCVPTSEKALYEAKAPLPILPHPDDINRLFLKIRWVHEYFKDADLVVKIDDDIPYKLMLIDHRYRQIQAEMHKQSGGMSVYRNTETIALSIDRLKRKWGGAIKIVMSKGRPAIRFRV